MRILHLCLANFYIDNYSYQENMLPKYHKMMGHYVSVIASKVSFDENGELCLLWIIRSIPTHFPELNPGFKKKAFSL